MRDFFVYSDDFEVGNEGWGFPTFTEAIECADDLRDARAIPTTVYAGPDAVCRLYPNHRI